MFRRGAQLLLLLLATLAVVQAYYVPGTYPQEFRAGDKLQAHVNSLKSFDTEMPYEYYTMPFCKPPEGVHSIGNTANPGTLLEGLRIENSVYNFTMKEEQTALSACPEKGYYGPLTASEVKDFKSKIDEHYRINMILDNLPVTVYDLLDENQDFVRPGFELGYSDNGKYYVYNHLTFNILVSLTHGEYTAALEQSRGSIINDIDVRKAARRQLSAGAGGAEEQQDGQAQRRWVAGGSATDLSGLRSSLRRLSRSLMADDKAKATPASGSTPGAEQDEDEEEDEEEEPYYMVVGFEVAPCSIAREAGKPIENVVCDDTKVQPQELKEGAKIVYSYDVFWQESSIKWASRWDAYLRMPGGEVHWFSIMNSIVVVLIMATIVAIILIRTVRRDLSKYEQLLVESSTLDMKDEAGWKLVTGDVFRAPNNSKMLAVQVASGFQIISTSTVTLLLASLGFLSPASRGALLTATIVVYIWLAVVAGFTGVYLWGLMERSYNGWPYICALVSVFFPGIVLLIFTFLNLVIYHTGTTGAIPIGMYFAIVAVWFLVSIPLTFVGGYLGVRLPIKDHPVKTNQIPRHIPPAPLSANPTILFFAAGLLPFGTVFIELYFALTSVWLGYFYYLFGFVFLIGLLTVVITAEIAVLCTYVQLCSEDYQWWWASFRRGGSVAVYVALYAIGFLMSSLSSMVGFMPILIYLSYMTVIILGAYFALGTVGFAASYLFVYYIFKAVKAD